MDSTDHKEFDRLYSRIIGRLAQPTRGTDALSLAELQALMDRVREQEEKEARQDTDPMPPESSPE
jgi:hypothetical protein